MATEVLFRFRGYENVHAYPSLAPVFGALLGDTTTDKDGTVMAGPYKDTPFVIADTVHAQTVKAVNARNGLVAADWLRSAEPLDPAQAASAQNAGLPV